MEVLKIQGGAPLKGHVKAAGAKNADKAGDAIRKAIAQARAGGDYDLVVIDGPAMPWSAADRKLLDSVDGLVAILPVSLDINDALEDIITALGGTERQLIGVVLSELTRAVISTRRDRQYA